MAESFSVRAILSATDNGFASTLKNAMGTAETLGSKIKSGLGFGVLTGIGQQAFSAISSGVSGLIGEMDSSNASWKTFSSNLKIAEANGIALEGSIGDIRSSLQKYAQETVYSASDMASTYAQLASVGTKNTTKLVKGFGGLAAAAENPQQAMKTLSQQATQMAAKPKVAWEDFKLMLEQTPAGMAAVANQMGMTSAELVSAIQNGEVATEDFFDAISEVGNSPAFANMATEAKTVGQAMDGLKETVSNKLLPSFDVLSQVGISAVEGITDQLGDLDGQAIADTVTDVVDTIKEGVSIFQTSFDGVGESVGSALSAIASSLGITKGEFSKTEALETFRSVCDSVAGTITKVSGFLEENADTVAAVLPWVVGLVAAFQGFRILNIVAPGLASFAGGLALMAGKGIAGLAGKLFGISGGTKAVGKSSTSLGGVIKTVFNGISNVVKSTGNAINQSLKGVGTAAKGIGAGLKSVFSGIGQALKVAKPYNILALGVAIGVVVAALALLSSQGGGFSNIITALGEAISNVVASLGPIITTVIDALAQALLTLSPILPEIATAFTMLSPLVETFGSALSSVVTAVGTAVATILPALQPIVETITSVFTTIAQIIGDTFVRIAEVLAPYIPIIVSAFTTLASIVSSTIVQIVQAIAPYFPQITAMVESTMSAIESICAVFNNLISQIAPIIQSVTDLIAQLGTTISDILSGTAEVVMSIGDSISGVIESIGSSISGVLDSIAGIFESMGQAAKNAGIGFESMANGLETIAGLGALGLLTSLASVGSALGDFASHANELQLLGTGMTTVCTSLMGISSSGAPAAAALMLLAQALQTILASGMQSAVVLTAAGQGFVVFANSARSSQSGLLAFLSVLQQTRTGVSSVGVSLGTASSGFSSVSIGSKRASSSLKSLEMGVQSVESGLDALGSVAKSAMDTLVSAMTGAAADAKTAGQKVGTGCTTGLQSGLSKSPGVAKSCVSSVTSTLRSGSSGAYSSGQYIGIGFANGMTSMLSRVRSAANQLVAQANRAIEAKAKIGSPSKITTQYGKWYGVGYVNGITDKVRDAWKAAEELVSFPMANVPQLAVAYAGEMSPDYEYSRNAQYTITVVSELDGKAVGMGTAKYVEKEINKNQTRENRKHGKR